MDFSFSADQLDFQAATREFLQGECPTGVLRNAWESEDGRSGLWPRLAELGLQGILVPEERGGFGLDEIDLVLLVEEAGRVALPDPFLESAGVVAPLLAEHDPKLAAGLAAGDLSATVRSPEDCAAPWGTSAELVLYWDGNSAELAKQEDLSFSQVESVDGARKLAQFEPADEPIVRFDQPEADSASNRGVTFTSAFLLGLAKTMLDLTVEYTKERKQFGVPIGTFQAVKHHLANTRVAIEFAQPLVYQAAYELSQNNRQATVTASAAKVQANTAANSAARSALQCHGAIGYTTEHDLHLFMKRAWALIRSWGDTEFHQDRVAAELLGN